VSLGIVESHSGSLSVDCPPEGGAAFEVLLPIQVPGVQEEAAPAVATPATNRAGPRLLIVDDEPEVGALLADILRRDASHIDIAASGREALQWLETREYDAILTDLRMPGLDGPELYRCIEQRWPKRARQVVFITGDALSPTVQTFLAGTGQPYLEKPFVPAEVREVVRETTRIRPATSAAHS
jgi:two-component system NtrC family sensor kinase